MNFDKLQTALSRFSSSAASIIKTILLSGRPAPAVASREGELIILGNGPSLREAIDKHSDRLVASPLMAVNFAANTPEFRTLQPEYYILADGHFFSNPATDPNVARIWNNLGATNWNMTLWIPRKYKKKATDLLQNNENIVIKIFNLTPLEGYDFLVHKLMDMGLGMPRPRNVMIPAIMAGIREGYRKILLAGADHTWTQTLSVDDDNFVVSVQPHFYADNEKEHARVRSTYAGLHLHDVLGSMTIAFRSYWHLASYASSRGIKIVNCTPGSMIDAFDRETL